MSGAASYSPAEADRLEQLTNDLSQAEWDEVWNIYAQRGYDSAMVAAKSYNTAFKARYKVVGDAIDMAIERLRAAATTAAAGRKIFAKICCSTTAPMPSTSASRAAS